MEKERCKTVPNSPDCLLKKENKECDCSCIRCECKKCTIAVDYCNDKSHPKGCRCGAGMHLLKQYRD